MRELGTIVGIAVVIAAASAVAVVQDGTGGGASANDSRSPAQACRDKGLEPGDGRAFGDCVSETASDFGKCVSDAAKNREGNPARVCGELKPVPANGSGGESSNTHPQVCRDEDQAPGNGNAFGNCVSGKANAFGKCVSGTAGPGSGNPAQTCESLKPGNGAGAPTVGPPAGLSAPPEQSEQALEPSVASESELGDSDPASSTGGIAAPAK